MRLAEAAASLHLLAHNAVAIQPTTSTVTASTYTFTSTHHTLPAGRAARDARFRQTFIPLRLVHRGACRARDVVPASPMASLDVSIYLWFYAAAGFS